jgi:hypothetical protein
MSVIETVRLVALPGVCAPALLDVVPPLLSVPVLRDYPFLGRGRVCTRALKTSTTTNGGLKKPAPRPAGHHRYAFACGYGVRC